MTKAEYEALIKASENYRKQKVVDEETKTLNDFEDLKKSSVFLNFKYVAIFGLLFSVLLLFDYYLPIHLKKGTIENITTNTTEKEDPFKNIIYFIKNTQVTVAFPNQSTTNINLSSDVSNLLQKNADVEVMQTAIFKIDIGIKQESLIFNTEGNRFKTFHWFMILFNLCLILLTFISKGPTPLFYIIINTAFYGIPIISGLFLIYALFN